MIRLTILLVALTGTFNCFSQKVKVSLAYRASFADGKKITYSDSIGPGQVFTIKKNGYVHLREKNGWTYDFEKSGTYTLDSLYNATINSREYFVFDGTRRVAWYLYCPERFVCGTCSRYLRDDHLQHSRDIEPIGMFAGKDQAFVPSQDFKLEWVHPQKDFDKMYYVILWNMFDEQIDVIKTKNSYIDLDLAKYNESTVLYRIVSEGCVQSTRRLIRVKK